MTSFPTSDGASLALQRQTVALAALFQALMLVRRLAQFGSAPAEQVQPVLQGVLRFARAGANHVYPETQSLSPGFETLRAQLGGRERDTRLLELAINVMGMAKVLRRQSKVSQALGETLATVDQAAGTSELADQLAAAYREHISGLKPGISVTGREDLLTDNAVASQIRALLLAAIRAAWLWEAEGGGRWRLVFRRAHYVRIATAFLAGQPATEQVTHP